MEDDKDVGDYLSRQIYQRPPIVLIRRPTTLTIEYKNQRGEFSLSANSNHAEIKSQIQTKFMFGEHQVELLDEGKPLEDSQLDALINSSNEQILLCNKLKKVHTISEDKVFSNIELSMKSTSKLKDVLLEISNKTCASYETLQLYFDQICQTNLEATLDDISLHCARINFSVEFIREFCVFHDNIEYIISYKPTDTITTMKSILEEKGFKDVNKFSFQLNNKSLSADTAFSLLNLSPGRHKLEFTSKTIIAIIIQNEEKAISCDEDVKTIGDLKRLLEKMTQVESSNQVLILMKDGEWQEKLTKEDQSILDLADQNLKILLKRSKKYALLNGMSSNQLTFEGLAGSTIKEQKKMLEIDLKLPVDQQVWILGKVDAPKVLHDDEFVEEYDLQTLTNNPVKIFRKVQLNICLSDNSVCINDVPTYEKIWKQKDKISRSINVSPEEQQWYYNDQELDDRKTVEECFSIDDPKNLQLWNSYPIDLTVQNDLEYFGFTEKGEINIGLFRDFFIDSNEEFDKIINETAFEDKNASLQFRNRILGVFFGTLKKHSLWEDLIHKIKKRAFELKGINLWEE